MKKGNERIFHVNKEKRRKILCNGKTFIIIPILGVRWKKEGNF